MKRELDYGKIVNEDDIINIEDNIKGVMVLLSGLSHADEAGSHQFQKEAYNTLARSLDHTLIELATIKESVNYMQEAIRE